MKNSIKRIAEGILIGALAGLTSVGYRFCLSRAESFLFCALQYIHENPLRITLWFILLLIFAFITARIVRWESMAAGSGIPQVAGEVKGLLDPCWWRVILAKFIGGTLCICGGLSLGREGPSIQLGAMAAKGYSRTRKYERSRESVLLSCGAGAGLAASFNAPLAGIVFILEEILHGFDPALLLTGTVSAVTADFISKMFWGQGTVFSFHSAAFPLRYYWLLLLFGLVLGLAGAGYNYVMLKGQALFRRMRQIPKEITIAFVFLLSGTLGLILPQILCGGHEMIQLLESGHPAVSMLLLLLLAKFAFSALSFGSGVPGGIFFPLLIMGAYIGAVCGDISALILPPDQTLWQQFIILGMAGLFAGIVRAPLTGILLIAEMTGNMHHFIDIALVSIIAYATANMLGSKPIYDSLLERIIQNHE